MSTTIATTLATTKATLQEHACEWSHPKLAAAKPYPSVTL